MKKMFLDVFSFIPSHWIMYRDLFGSDIIIVITIMVHLIEGIVLLVTTDADWPINMYALLTAGHHNHILVGTVLIVACLLAIAGEWGNGVVTPGMRICFLMTQFILLLIMFVRINMAVYDGQFPCATVNCTGNLSMSRIGIFCDQIFGFFWPGMYLAAVWVRVRYK